MEENQEIFVNRSYKDRLFRFIFREKKDLLELYEHQSTFSPNLPLRGLFYFARVYQKYVGNRKDIYSSKVIELPYPQFYVFYNGTGEEPEWQVLELNAAYPPGFDKENAALRLIQLLVEAGRTEDVARVTVDEEYRKQLYEEFCL